MKTIVRFFAVPFGLVLLSALAVPDAQAKPRGASEEARVQMLDGRVKSLKEIEAQVLPKMRGMTYLGPEYDPQTRIYRLKFIQDNHVIFVDVDGQSGRILRRR
ncbi:hypothetical protein [Alterisphingorhabdus coralli]|uniref:PepSY domain-containing protein n=1 Tax=Alterisphingorhabdus coralli TaxID=3071408 RepID=A0AA97F4W1_9SPHN|nr:hypothetical protein [Parasphingorhabdus sp. SCSIO 66989]WOE74276.1 hypothetical protein RB602_10465 [Parasphingorhabdus sp. SCSIO 66989]